jgi:hypothetical protein
MRQMAARFAGDAPPAFSAAHTATQPISGHEIAGQHGAQGCHVAAVRLSSMTPTDWCGRKVVKAWLVRSYPLLPLWG